MLRIDDLGNQPIKMIDKSNVTRIKSERAWIISQFVEEINKERLGTKYKPLSGKAVAIKLSHLKDNGTLYYFLSTCKDYRNRHGSFSKMFFGSLKVNRSF